MLLYLILLYIILVKKLKGKQKLKQLKKTRNSKIIGHLLDFILLPYSKDTTLF